MFGLPEPTEEETKKLMEPDSNFTFSDAALRYMLEAVWQFIENRGAAETRYVTSVERRVEVYYLGHKGQKAELFRMLRTTQDWMNSAWEIDDHGFLFEVDGGKVTSPRIKDPQKARQELFRMLLSMMAVCGTKAEYQENLKA